VSHCRADEGFASAKTLIQKVTDAVKRLRLREHTFLKRE
jgi:hypothetical protein